MFYREAGQFKKSYAADMAIFPILQDRIGLAVILAVAFVAIPVFGSNFLIQTVMIPFLVFALAAIGLNILTGYTGLISLGSGAFMGVGAYACYKLTTIFPGVNIVIWILASGFFAAAIGVVFGLPSLRIKGFYLTVATLAAQFFLQWSFVRIPWLYNYNASGAIEVPQRLLAGLPVTGANALPVTRYLVLLSIVVLLTWIASNLVHGRIGRSWMAVRDMDIAAELMGIRLLPAKLLSFAVSSFYCGVAGACMMFLWYGGGEANDAFNINQSFIILFMVIIGGLGSIIGSYFGAAFISILPTALKFGLPAMGIALSGPIAEHFNYIILGVLILFFLIVEPHGLARLWQIGKQKLRVWPFPY
ncbi:MULTISPECIES: branched-chain amino acid ABC transporter permease [unclassified Beijerinckia]|uniref:branched-chain amino acid ABC transporter permease n=1 Tax=unclassified Beijerinckia TaxID=2638183 RepID=UPI0008985A36|nr:MULTISPECIES: branched-chain amino acid ABC transporter permease [unclassified Beijerinckia]MDH7796909.1 branched-chain amino acid transport system permease protein [Beijerinckia sp. GAS462]SEC64775.1 amino acid/amide ABC transporter membrane protein 2, HAAT family [Beijerinckia sp. 28-YEA-48]